MASIFTAMTTRKFFSTNNSDSQLCVCIIETLGKCWDILEDSDSSQPHMVPHNLFLRRNMKLSPSKGMEHRNLYGIRTDIYGCYNEASFRKSLDKVDIHHCNSDACMHGGCNHAFLSISSHRLHLDSKAPPSSSSHTGKP